MIVCNLVGMHGGTALVQVKADHLAAERTVRPSCIAAPSQPAVLTRWRENGEPIQGSVLVG
jgi:hypothetical protein